MQGAGWLTLEDLRWDDARDRPAAGCHPVGQHLQAAQLLRDARGLPRRAAQPTPTRTAPCYGSKAVGEPPLMLAFSVREALRQAAAAFGPAGTSVDLASPATPEAVYWAVEAGPCRRRCARSRCRRAPAAPAGRRRRRSGPESERRSACSASPERARGLVPGGRPAAHPAGAGRPGHRGRRSAGTPRGTPARRWWSPPTRPGAPSAAATSRPSRSTGPARCWPAARGPELRRRSRCRTRRRTSTACSAAAVRSSVLLEPLPVVPAVAVFGVGHVGLELARILARHDLDLHLVDSRPEQLTAERLAVLDDALATVHVHHVPVLPELVLGRAARRHPRAGHDPRPRRGRRALRRRAAHRRPRLDRADRLGRQVGPVPRARCAPRARRRGVDRITTPIGLPDLTGKDPATIAVSVAAALHDCSRTAPRSRPPA